MKTAATVVHRAILARGFEPKVKNTMRAMNKAAAECGLARGETFVRSAWTVRLAWIPWLLAEMFAGMYCAHHVLMFVTRQQLEVVQDAKHLPVQGL